MFVLTFDLVWIDSSIISLLSHFTYLKCCITTSFPPEDYGIPRKYSTYIVYH